MNIINAVDFGIVPKKEVGKELIKLFDAVKGKDSTTIIFQKGVYYIDSQICQEHLLHITNTVADSEFSKQEKPHIQKTAFYLSRTENLTIDGNDSVFVINGKMTNFAMENCQNIILKNIEFRHAQPDIHELKVAEKSPFCLKFVPDKVTNVEFKGGKPYFCAKDYSYPADLGAATANWIIRLQKGNSDYCQRVKHPLSGALKYKKTDDGFLAYYINTSRFNVGDRFYIYDVRRQFVGIFINESKNITLENVRQGFNYSLALVLQCSENITVSNCAFAPDSASPLLIASCADFIQSSMCRGKIAVSHCKFVGAGDDCMNVHGIHFKVVKVEKNEITVKFMHGQTHGFDPFKAGDEIGFIDVKTLLEKGRTEIISSNLINEYEILLKLKSCDHVSIGDAIENISACPQVLFENNEISRIVTRGLLLTTRGKAQIINNNFISTAMSGILMSDDAANWYESGMCEDVLIKGNCFGFCGDVPILIKPENKVYGGGIHKNIRIENNSLNFDAKCFVKAFSGDNIKLCGNNIGKAKLIEHKNCRNITVE